MRVLAHVHYAWPRQRGGSEVAMHRTLAWLADRGHEVRGIVTQISGVPCDGVEYRKVSVDVRHSLWDWADVAITQQGASVQAVEMSEIHRKPVFHWAHNWLWFEAYSEHLRPGVDTVIWNSDRVAEAQGAGWEGASLVLRPPTLPGQYPLSEGDRFTQVNLSKLKGGEVFWHLTQTVEAPFLAVVGGWGKQIDARGGLHEPGCAAGPLAQHAAPNVQVIPATTDMIGDVYSRTRVLLVPTGYVNPNQTGESWGLVAAEALCSGIPVIATDSPGMRELAGTSATLLPHDEIAAWEHHVRRLSDPSEWAEASANALARRPHLDPTTELEALEAAMGVVACCAS